MTSSDASIRDSRADRPEDLVRAIAHDLNGALNTLVLNIELLDASAAGVDGSAAAPAQRARSLAAMRRAVRELQEIVEHRLLPVGREVELGASGRPAPLRSGVPRD